MRNAIAWLATCALLMACTTTRVAGDDDDEGNYWIDRPGTGGSGGVAEVPSTTGPGSGATSGTGTGATTGSSGGSGGGVAGSGGEGGEGAGGNVPMGPTCEQIATKLCELSCDCTQNDADPRCRYLYQGPHPDGGNTLQMRTQEIPTCEDDLATDLCGDTTKTEQELGTCLSQLDSGMCVMSPLGGSKHVYELNAACFTVFECESGPCLQ